ncbi:MAG: acyl-CoA dehydrogenase family protein [Acidobacteriota bacterium]
MIDDLPFFLTPQHSEIWRQLDEFCVAHAQLLEAERSDEEAHALEVVHALGAACLLELTVPAAYRSQSSQALQEANTLDVRALCLARERLAYASALADLMFAMQGLGSYPITLAGTNELKSRYLPGVAGGELVAAFAITEPSAGSDTAAMLTTAVRDGNNYILNGSKRFISNAGIANFYTIFAKTDPDIGHRGISAFVIDADTPGLQVDRLQMISPHPIGELALNDCRIPVGQLLGTAGEGFKLAMRTLDTFRSSVGAAAVGLGTRARDEALHYARLRQQFGRPLSELQAIQFKLAEISTELEAARLLVYRAAWCKDNGKARVTREAAMAKLFATEAAQHAIDEAVQIHGGSGLVRGAVTERLYRDIRAMRIYEGTSEIQKLVIASQLLQPIR